MVTQQPHLKQPLKLFYHQSVEKDGKETSVCVCTLLAWRECRCCLLPICAERKGRYGLDKRRTRRHCPHRITIRYLLFYYKSSRCDVQGDGNVGVANSIGWESPCLCRCFRWQRPPSRCGSVWACGTSENGFDCKFHNRKDYGIRLFRLPHTHCQS